MLIKHLKEITCSTCGSPTVREEVLGAHCNGMQRESRKFACGRTVEWSPNFGRAETRAECPKEPSEVIKRQIRAEDRVAFVELAQLRGWSDAQIRELKNFMDSRSAR